jgi:hypothetical protein
MNTVRDLEGNYLLMDVEHKNQRFTFGAVYGANTNDGIQMYDNLQRDILLLKNEKIILGGGLERHI